MNNTIVIKCYLFIGVFLYCLVALAVFNLKKRKIKTHSIIKFNKIGLGLLSFLFVFGCQTDDENLQDTKNSNTAEVFIDAPIGMGTDFYKPYGPDALNPVGSKFTAWTIDKEEGYNSTISMRFDVPNADNPEGNYAGSAFIIDGVGRDLTSYDALTFWAKASPNGVTNLEFGFGEDFGENKYQATIKGVSLGTAWVKYIIPIPDASKLAKERGMFRYAANTQGTKGKGFAFWVDELKFEKLGTIGNPRPKISNGEDKEDIKFLENSFSMADYSLSQTFNMASGVNQKITAAPSYFSFVSSNTDVAKVSDAGIVNIVGSGTSKITGSIAGVSAVGSLTVNVPGKFPVASDPILPQSKVISVFSDKYANIPINFYNGYWQPYQTTEGGLTVINSQNVLNYTKFNFVGTGLKNPIDISEMTHFSVDILMLELPTDIDLLLTFKNESTRPNTFQQNRIGQSYQLDARAPVVFKDTEFKAGVWATIKVPIRPKSDIANLDKTGVSVIIIENIKSSKVKTLYLDNMYFYKE